MYLLFIRNMCSGLLTCLLVLVFMTACSDSGESTGTELVEQAQQFMVEGKLRHALIKLKESIQDDPDNGVARMLLARIYLQQGQASNAEIEARKAIKLGVPRQQWVPVLGRSLLMQARFDAVIQDFKEEAQDNAQIKAEIALMKGDAYVATKDLKQAREQYSQALLYQPALLGPVYGMARVSIGEGDYARALEYLDKVLSKDAKHLAAIIKKGDLYLQSGEKEQAQALYDHAVRAHPDSQESLLKRAYVLIGLGKMDDARKDVDAVLKVNTRVPLAHYLNARLYFSQGNLDRASDALQEAFSIQPDYHPAQLLNGLVAIAKSRYRLAETSLERHLSENANHLLSVKLLALTQLHLGAAEKVVERFTNMSASLRLDREALAIVGVAALLTGDVKKGESALKASYALRTSANSNATRDEESNSGGDELQEQKIFKQFFTQVMNAEVKKLLQDAKPSSESFYHAGLIRMSLGETTVAQEHLRQALERGLAPADAYIALAQIDIDTRKWTQAVKRLQSALKDRPKDVVALASLVRVYELMDDPALSLAGLQQTWKREPTSLVVGLSLLQRYLKDRQLGQADSISSALFAAHSDNTRLTENITKMYANAGYAARAIDLLQARIEAAPTQWSNVLLLADMEARQGQWQASEELYNKVLKQEPENRYAMLGLIRLHLQARDYESASTIAEKLIATDPEASFGYQVRGQVAAQAGQYPAAVKWYAIAMKKGSDEKLLSAYVKALIQNNNQEQAILEARNWLFVHPFHYRVRLQLAGIYQQSRQIDHAIEQYLVLEKLEPVRPIALNNLIWLFVEAGDARLQEYVERLAVLKPDAAEIKDTLGWAYLKLGQKEKAGQYLLSAAEQLKDNPSVQYHLAVYWHSIGNMIKAKALLDALAGSDQVFAEKEEAQKLLSTL